WRTLPWNLDLGNHAAIPPSIDKTAELWIQPHTSGLTCIRLTILDQKADPGVLPAIEQMIGCRPAVKSDPGDDRDWVLEAECIQPEAVQDSEVVSSIRLEPLATTLRNAGLSELFLYVQHTPLGATRLSPRLRDSWLGAGMQEYVDRRSLR